MDEFTGWARDLTVEVAGRGVVSHTGSVALRVLADRTGLTAAGSRPCMTGAGSSSTPP